MQHIYRIKGLVATALHTNLDCLTHPGTFTQHLILMLGASTTKNNNQDQWVWKKALTPLTNHIYLDVWPSMPLSFSVLCLEQLLGSNLGKDKKSYSASSRNPSLTLFFVSLINTFLGQSH